MLIELFREDHARLLKLLDNFIGDGLKESLIIFVGNVRRHIVLENEVIFKLSNNKELREVNKRILGDHTQYLKIISKAETVDIDNVDIDSIKNLREPFSKHNLFEDTYFYPVLEKILSSEDIADLVDKVKDEVNFA